MGAINIDAPNSTKAGDELLNRRIGQPEAKWIELRPVVMQHDRARPLFRSFLRALIACNTDATSYETLGATRAMLADSATGLDRATRALFLFTGSALCDLRAQGWSFRLEQNRVLAAAPVPELGSSEQRKAQIRAAHLLERDAQLAQPSVQAFVRDMERPRLTAKGWHSIFSLMRSGDELASTLSKLALQPESNRVTDLQEVIRPYVQVVDTKSICEHTQLRLGDVWRYFRHTWNTTYNSTPGRQLWVLVRDAAARNHPVVGIGALGSSIVQLSKRDRWIGWTPAEFISRLRGEATKSWAAWVLVSLETLIAEIYVKDFVAAKEISRSDLSRPNRTAIKRLREIAREARRIHRLYPDRTGHKRGLGSDSVDWEARARTNLFKSKRAQALGDLLQISLVLREAGLTRPSAKLLRSALDDGAAVAAIQSLVRRVKAAHVGVDMMDVTVCGAVAPYNELLGGKLVALMMTSPNVVRAYHSRYRNAPSVIASSMAGRPVVRRSSLVLLGTTSLFDVASSQYNRIRMPAMDHGGGELANLEYINLGRTAGYGSFHFSRETLRLMEVLLARGRRGRPVNSIFGEGVNPKLRKVRSALDLVGLSPEMLLRHGSSRIVYAVPLASNFRNILLGRSVRPSYLFPQNEQAVCNITSFWIQRWLSRRIERDEVLQRISRHTLTHPIAHGARVPLPETSGLGPLFEDGE